MRTIPFLTESELDRDEILAHLDQILADRRFASAERNARFLRFVVESALDGKACEIKETVIATEVYGRPNDYDPKSDSIVRVEASRLRQKLRSYYENEGRRTLIRFHLSSGSYVPSFEKLDEAAGRERLPLQPVEIHEPQIPAIPRLGISDDPVRREVIKRSPPLVGACIILAVTLLSIPALRQLRSGESRDPEAVAAWQEGVALMALDPHTAATESGPPKTILRAIERIEFAVARNPSLAQAWASLAEAYDYASAYVGRDLAEDGRRMEAASRRAIAADQNLAAGHHMLGLYYKGFEWDFARAEAAYRHSLRLNPLDADAVVEYADLLWETGRLAEAAQEIRKSRALLPASPTLAVKEAEIQAAMGRPDAALVTARSAIELKRTYLRAYVALGMAHERKGEFDSALAQYEHVLEVNPFDRRALPAYGHLLARTGRMAAAREIIARLEKMNSMVRNCAVQIAVVHAGLGDDNLSLDWLERAWRTRQSHFPFVGAEWRFRSLHQNPRFREILAKAGLKPVLQ